uniref:Photoreceptor cilium actin regulator n=2 Tax=Podarcis muralis TaxID=64176 RepID=A0A670HRH9_PODMU
MGCTPSHSDIANHNVTHGIKSLNRGILPVDPEGEGSQLPMLIKCSSSYDLEELCQGETQIRDHFFENSSDDDKNVNFRSSSEDPSLPEIDQEEKEMERVISETEIAISELTVSPTHMVEDIKVRKQNSSASEEIGFALEDNDANNEKQNPKKGKKQKSIRQRKQNRHCKIKEKPTPPECKAEEKVDFPELLVKAHQNAYAYLNPNLSKYEVILCMANQATETQLIMQQMVSFLLLRFDEINHLLGEIAQDGEGLLRDVGGNLAWPAGKGNLKEQPDLLQQLLQYTVNKMQLLNGTVASLTSDALQESCSFLQSAGSSLEEKLKAKQAFDERLLRTIKLLEASAVKPSHSHPDDMTLYSEDSGIGIDSESVKDLNLLDKQGIQKNCDSSSHDHPSLNPARPSGEDQWSCTSLHATGRSHDCALERQFKDIFYPPAPTKSVMPSSAVAPGSTVLQYQNISKTSSPNSMNCGVIHEGGCFKDCESTTNEDSDDSSLSEEEGDNLSLSEKGTKEQPRSSPAATYSKRRPSTKRIESPENEEITLKMKDAISEKIKFVPAKSGKRDWVEDENGKMLRRPSTAAGSQKAPVKKKRSRSEESLKSHAEDPTLLELQRTQKGLDKRLEMFYTLNGNKDLNDKTASLNPKEPSNLQDSEHVIHRSSTKKLKASLAKNFSILPNQDKVPLFRRDQNAFGQQTGERKCRKPVTSTTPPMDPTSKKENELPGTQKLNSVGCAPPRKSVKKLIETFSTAESLVKPPSLRILGPIKCVRKFGLPSITPSLPLPRGLAPLNHKHRVSPIGDINCRNINPAHCTLGTTGSPVFASGSGTNGDSDDDGDDSDDMEDLPPPPPDMLMDISPDSATSPKDATTGENYSEIAKTNEHFSAKKVTHISQRMKASLCSIDLLPSKNLNSPSLITNKATKSARVDFRPRKYSLELNSSFVSDNNQDMSSASPEEHEVEETTDLYKQTCKLIPLQNPKEMPEQDAPEPGNKDCSTPSASAQKRGSPDSPSGSEKMTALTKRVSPARTPPSSPPSEKRLPSPPLHHRHINQASSPTTHRQPSPPANPRASSSPTQRKQPSPPTQQNLSSPPLGRKQQSPPTHRKVSSPPALRREASPPPFSTTPSPPTSPSWLHKGLRNHLDSGNEQQTPILKIVSNTRSIFCPATSSLFEAKPVLPPNSSTTEAMADHPEGSAFAQRNSKHLRQCGDQQRRVSLSAANPQPFVRRSSSDRRPGFQRPLPFFATSGSEPVLIQTRMEESHRQEVDSWNSPCSSEGRKAGKSSSHPELYIVGQGLQKD